MVFSNPYRGLEHLARASRISEPKYVYKTRHKSYHTPTQKFPLEYRSGLFSGMNKEELEAEILVESHGLTVVVRGRRTETIEGTVHTRAEEFRLPLPEGVQPSHVSIKFEDDLLIVKVDKADAQRAAKTIPVEIN